MFMNSCELVTLISSIACTIAKNCSPEDISLMAAIFNQLGETLGTILTNEELCQKSDNKSVLRTSGPDSLP